MKKRTLFYVLFGIFLMIVVLFGEGAFRQHIKIVQQNETETQQIEKDTHYVTTHNLAEVVAYFKTISQKKGGLYAFSVLRNIPADIKIDRHLVGHVIGAELYAQKGIDSLKLCTAEFAYSCYHSVLGSAVAEFGLNIVSDLNKICMSTDDLWACQHGIGHGIVATTGYDNPEDALNVCATLSVQGQISGCIEGVFMEFDSWTMIDSTGNSQRELSDKGPYYPCDTVAVQYRNACYYEQPSWWRGVYGKENYAEIGRLCDAIENETEKSWCFRRIGVLKLDAADGTLDTAVEKCTIGAVNESERAYCLQMLRSKSTPDSEVCNVLESPYRETCESPVPER